MKNKFNWSFLMAFGLLFTFAPTQAFAKPVAERQKNLAKREMNGYKDGSLTKKEAKVLIKKRIDIKEDIRAAKADGQMSKEERLRIKLQQEKLSSKTYKLKHNEETGNEHTHADARILNQSERINSCVENGECTAAERKKLRAEQKLIADSMENLKEDGSFSADDEALIDAQQDAASQHIRDQNTNAQVRSPSGVAK